MSHAQGSAGQKQRPRSHIYYIKIVTRLAQFLGKTSFREENYVGSKFDDKLEKSNQPRSLYLLRYYGRSCTGILKSYVLRRHGEITYLSTCHSRLTCHFSLARQIVVCSALRSHSTYIGVCFW